MKIRLHRVRCHILTEQHKYLRSYLDKLPRTKSSSALRMGALTSSSQNFSQDSGQNDKISLSKNKLLTMKDMQKP